MKENLNSELLSNAQLLLRKAVLEADLSPAINDTTEFSAKLSVQYCEATSPHGAECEAEIVRFQMWNVSVLMHE